MTLMELAALSSSHFVHSAGRSSVSTINSFHKIGRGAPNQFRYRTPLIAGKETLVGLAGAVFVGLVLFRRIANCNA